MDATDVSAGPVARVILPRRVPAGFHGSWIPEEN
jgi:carotenoid cleavage dioxygenase